MEYVWYASYGSNLLQSRFNCYIQGGVPIGSAKMHKGCTDTTLPAKSRTISIKGKLYFAQNSKSWGGGGVAFINENNAEESRVAGRMYLITREQFEQIVMQENDLSQPFFLNIEESIKHKKNVFDEDIWYGKILFLGNEEGYPILTFTNPNHQNNRIVPPNENYLTTIVKGLKECYNWSNKELIDYLGNAEGIKGYVMENQLMELLKF